MPQIWVIGEFLVNLVTGKPYSYLDKLSGASARPAALPAASNAEQSVPNNIATSSKPTLSSDVMSLLIGAAPNSFNNNMLGLVGGSDAKSIAKHQQLELMANLYSSNAKKLIYKPAYDYRALAQLGLSEDVVTPEAAEPVTNHMDEIIADYRSAKNS